MHGGKREAAAPCALEAQCMTWGWVRGGMVQPARAMAKPPIGFMPEFLAEALEPEKRIVRP